MSLYLITGGAGFIGSHIVEALVKQNARVRVLDNFSTGKRENLQTLKNAIALIEGDIRDREAVCKALNGNTPTLPKRENMRLRPLSPYATSKLAAENDALNFYHVYQLPVVCLRYFNFFGPRQDPFSQYAAVIPRFIEAFLKNKRPVIYRAGEQIRDFIHVENIVHANLSVCTCDSAIGQAINIACGTRTA